MAVVERPFDDIAASNEPGPAGVIGEQHTANQIDQDAIGIRLGIRRETWRPENQAAQVENTETRSRTRRRMSQ